MHTNQNMLNTKMSFDVILSCLMPLVDLKINR